MDDCYSNFSIKSEEEEEEEETQHTDNDSNCVLFGPYKKYENDETNIHDLFELLRSWNQLELFEHFTNEKIDLEVLAVIKPHHFERLLEPFNLRTHIMFEHNLQQWRDTIGLPLPTYPETLSYFRPHRSRRNSPRSFQYINSLSPTVSQEPPSSIKEISPPTNTASETGRKVTLDIILKANIKGKMLVDIYEQNKKFEESQRTLLINIIAEYFNDKGIHLELSETYNIEKDIISKFPSEQLEYYRTSKRGRIYNKYCNYKYSLVKVARSSTSKETSSTTTVQNEAEPITDLDIETPSNFGPHRIRRNSSSRSLQHINSTSRITSPKPFKLIEKNTLPTFTDSRNRVSLDTILKSSLKGKMLIGIYERNKKFEESHRTSLIHLIAEYFNDKGIHLELGATYIIEEEIISKFPSEKLEFYRTSKRGRIYNKFCNYKYSLARVARSSISNIISSTVTSSNEAELTTDLVPEEDAELHISILKNETISAEQFEDSWRACTKYRINEIKGLNSVPFILTKWPQYKSPDGHKYIAMDFKYLEPNWYSLVHNWDSVSSKLLKFLSSGQSIKSHEIKFVLSSIKDTTSKDCRDAAMMWCLHGYLKSLSKISIKESQDSFVYVAKSMQDIDIHRQVLYQQFNKTHPFIAVLGTNILNFSKIFVCLDDVKYSIEHFKNALDLCYNIMILFNLGYPTACKAVWSFIQNIFFETKPKTHFPRVHVLLNELKDK